MLNLEVARKVRIALLIELREHQRKKEDKKELKRVQQRVQKGGGAQLPFFASFFVPFFFFQFP
jgi:hypothetical protein